ncbi:trehalose-phosphatase [Thermodesulfobacteriota bacterium]
MENPTNGINLNPFFHEVSHSSKRALLLDYNGTLAPFSVDRDRAFPYPGERELLDAILDAGHTRVVLISGRSVQSLVPLLEFRKWPELWGSHGIERMAPDGSTLCVKIPEEASRAITSEREWMEEQGLMEHCEIKPFSLALHVRGLDRNVAKDLTRRLSARWSRLLLGSGLFVHEFDGGVELRTKGFHKGQAVITILNEMGNDSVSAYLGDDFTDEDAFERMRGRGMGILVREEFRPTVADARLRPPDQLLWILRHWHDAGEGKK